MLSSSHASKRLAPVWPGQGLAEQQHPARLARPSRSPWADPGGRPFDVDWLSRRASAPAREGGQSGNIPNLNSCPDRAGRSSALELATSAIHGRPSQTEHCGKLRLRDFDPVRTGCFPHRQKHVRKPGEGPVAEAAGQTVFGLRSRLFGGGDRELETGSAGGVQPLRKRGLVDLPVAEPVGLKCSCAERKQGARAGDRGRQGRTRGSDTNAAVNHDGEVIRRRKTLSRYSGLNHTQGQSIAPRQRVQTRKGVPESDSRWREFDGIYGQMSQFRWGFIRVHVRLIKSVQTIRIHLCERTARSGVAWRRLPP